MNCTINDCDSDAIRKTKIQGAFCKTHWGEVHGHCKHNKIWKAIKVTDDHDRVIGINWIS